VADIYNLHLFYLRLIELGLLITESALGSGVANAVHVSYGCILTPSRCVACELRFGGVNGLD